MASHVASTQESEGKKKTKKIKVKKTKAIANPGAGASESSGGGSKFETTRGGDKQINGKDPSGEEGDGRGDERGDL
jgi:hypothetical protein